MQDENILIWLPSPLGDAVLCTPSLRAIRRCFESSQLTFLARPAVREILSPNNFNNSWIEQKCGNPFAIAKMLKSRKFTYAVLFKNSFASALAVFLAGIPSRIGYARQGRSLFLTERLHPPKLPDGRFKPMPMLDYYLAIASWLSTDTADRNLELSLDPNTLETLKAKLPRIQNPNGPIVILVPGGAFGPSKCWPAERFAQTADWLIDSYNATVVISVSPDRAEKKIAEEICDAAKHKLVSTAEKPVSIGELKSLFSIADLVISNDTGPRHIAIAFRRRLITLFGPNDPAWTDSGCENEIQIVGDAPCAPCARPVCNKKDHLCMLSITVEMIRNAAKKLLENNKG